jgi:anti-anti-sigma factor
MKLSEEIIDGLTVLHLAGSLTQEGTPVIEKRFKELASSKGARVVIDIGKVDAITTPAITIFLTTVRAIEATGGRMIFANVRGITSDIFTRCRLDVIFTLAPNMASALKLARE